MIWINSWREPLPQHALMSQDAFPYQLLGAADGVRALVERFYQLMERSPQYAGLRKLHRNDLSQTKELLFQFLSGWLGGPNLYFQGPGHRCVMSAHRNIAIGAEEVEQWLGCMNAALEDTDLEKGMRDQISLGLSRFANRMRNKN